MSFLSALLLPFHQNQDMAEWLSSIGADACNENGESIFDGLASLQGGFLLPGDVLYLPACTVVLEKAVVEHNISFRAISSFANSRVYQLYRLYSQVYPKKLVR